MQDPWMWHALLRLLNTVLRRPVCQLPKSSVLLSIVLSTAPIHP